LAEPSLLNLQLEGYLGRVWINVLSIIDERILISIVVRTYKNQVIFFEIFILKCRVLRVFSLPAILFVNIAFKLDDKKWNVKA